MAQYDERQPEGRYDFREQLRTSGPDVRRGLVERQFEHGVCQNRTGAAADNLYPDVPDGLLPSQAATVAPVLAINATAAFPAESRSAMMPEPMTAAASRSDPKPSANSLRIRGSADTGAVR